MKIPDKLYFKIGEVSKIVGLPAYVLRFWENEFACIRPKRTSAGQRLYRRNDVEMVLKIRHLLHEKKFTIQGAKQHLSAQKSDAAKNKSAEILTELRTELESIRDILEN
jgi:DNA-binding transcriptional MerR regulator